MDNEDQTTQNAGEPAVEGTPQQPTGTPGEQPAGDPGVIVDGLPAEKDSVPGQPNPSHPGPAAPGPLHPNPPLPGPLHPGGATTEGLPARDH